MGSGPRAPGPRRRAWGRGEGGEGDGEGGVCVGILYLGGPRARVRGEGEGLRASWSRGGSDGGLGGALGSGLGPPGDLECRMMIIMFFPASKRNGLLVA